MSTTRQRYPFGHISFENPIITPQSTWAYIIRWTFVMVSLPFSFIRKSSKTKKSRTADDRVVFAQNANKKSGEGEVSRVMSRAWIRFAHDLNPNGPDVLNWPAYDATTKPVLQIRAGNMTIVPDNWRVDGIHFLGHDKAWLAATDK